MRIRALTCHDRQWSWSNAASSATLPRGPTDRQCAGLTLPPLRAVCAQTSGSATTSSEPASTGRAPMNGATATNAAPPHGIDRSWLPECRTASDHTAV
jgi:hypothetical protein